MVKKIAIIGGGLTGLSLSLYLAKRGYQVCIYETRPEIKQEPDAYISGRAMSLDLSERGITALSELNVIKPILKSCVPMRRRVFHDLAGQLSYLNYGRHQEEYLHAVSRYDVYKALIDSANKTANIQIYFKQKFIDWDMGSGKITFENQPDQRTYQQDADIVIGCDGAHSKVRELLEGKLEIYFRKHLLKQHYKELTIPAEKAGQLEKEAMHIWSRGAFKLVAQPNLNGSFTCALLLAKTGVLSFQQLQTKQTVENFFQLNFADAYPLMSHLCEEFFTNPIGELWTISSGHWQLDGKLIILGDACHAMVPFFGQGMNCALEDCRILNQYLDRFNDDWQKAIAAFAIERIKDTEAISTMSLENYPELQIPEIQQNSFLKKNIEQLLTREYAKYYTSYHNLVCFEQDPYRYAQFCKTLQQQLLENLSQGIHHIDELNREKAVHLLKEYKQHVNNYYQQ